jgi:hypothetical protein
VRQSEDDDDAPQTDGYGYARLAKSSGGCGCAGLGGGAGFGFRQAMPLGGFGGLGQPYRYVTHWNCTSGDIAAIMTALSGVGIFPPTPFTETQLRGAVESAVAATIRMARRAQTALVQRTNPALPELFRRAFGVPPGEARNWTEGQNFGDVVRSRLQGIIDKLSSGDVVYFCWFPSHPTIFSPISCPASAFACTAGGPRIGFGRAFWSTFWNAQTAPSEQERQRNRLDLASTLLHETVHAVYRAPGGTGRLYSPWCYELFVPPRP